MCRNTAEPTTVCLLSLLCAVIQLSLLLCACSTCCMPQYNIPFSNPSWSQYNLCIVTQYLSQPNQPPQSQYNRCIATHLSPSQNCTTVKIQFVVLQYSSQPTTHLSCNTLPLLQYNFPAKPTFHPTVSQYNCCLEIQFPQPTSLPIAI